MERRIATCCGKEEKVEMAAYAVYGKVKNITATEELIGYIRASDHTRALRNARRSAREQGLSITVTRVRLLPGYKASPEQALLEAIYGGRLHSRWNR